MIAFAIARARRILLISFPLPVTRENLQRLDVEHSAVTRREGAMDMIVDFSASPPVAIPHDDPRVQVVRNLETAFAELAVAPGEFEPLHAADHLAPLVSDK